MKRMVITPRAENQQQQQPQGQEVAHPHQYQQQQPLPPPAQLVPSGQRVVNSQQNNEAFNELAKESEDIPTNHHTSDDGQTFWCEFASADWFIYSIFFNKSLYIPSVYILFLII